jgi:glucan phosphoethanolaminetransferase (alkaline phosphatase superfamily)
MDNLKYVMLYVEEFIKKYPHKKIVITADHGNYLGEDGHYGHHPPRSKILTTVPWWTSW